MNYKKMTLEELEHEMCKQLKKENKELRKQIDELCEQTKWTKYDPNDPSTHPQKRLDWLVFTRNGNFFVMPAPDTEEIKHGWDMCVTHWRPLPKPPVEMENRNED